MSYKQQLQTKKFFETEAYAWSQRADVKKNKIKNTIIERNLFAFEIIKKNKLKFHLDVGCGSGDLSFLSSRITNSSIGIDFSKKMIQIAKKKFKNKNLQYFNASIFDFQNHYKFDAISANGFIEYLSNKDVFNFMSYCKSNLKKGGFLILGSRNRLFNLFSLNQFSLHELKTKYFQVLYNEAIALNNMTLKEFSKRKKLDFMPVPFKQPMTRDIKVNIRNQFSPSQIMKLMKKYGFKVTDINPINYHPATPKVYNSNLEYKKISDIIISYNNKLSLIPFSSSFIVAAKKI
jgi:2-polyprenyl-3-methyl-5-hydroxy-6-metoxy-1,4-benzoquinol methylase